MHAPKWFFGGVIVLLGLIWVQLGGLRSVVELARDAAWAVSRIGVKAEEPAPTAQTGNGLYFDHTEQLKSLANLPPASAPPPKK